MKVSVALNSGFLGFNLAALLLSPVWPVHLLGAVVSAVAIYLNWEAK